MIMYNMAMGMSTGRLLVGKAELHQPRNLGEVALGELSLALVPSVCSGSTPSTEEDQHHSLEPTRRPAAACLGILSIVCTVILLGGSIV